MSKKFFNAPVFKMHGDAVARTTGLSQSSVENNNPNKQAHVATSGADSESGATTSGR